jgi:hypothetical protein
VRRSIPHRFRFDRPLDLRRREDWDELRLGEDDAFGLTDDPAAWLARARDPLVVARAAALDRLLGDARAVASYGVGTGVTERALYALDPERRIVVTEFAPRTAGRLTRLFPESVVLEHDVSSGPIPDLDIHIFFRIDTELDDDQFRAVLQRFRRERVVVVATELLSVRAVLRETVTWLRGGSVSAGRVRSRGAFEQIFAETHAARAVRVADLDGFVLTPLS